MPDWERYGPFYWDVYEKIKEDIRKSFERGANESDFEMDFPDGGSSHPHYWQRDGIYLLACEYKIE